MYRQVIAHFFRQQRPRAEVRTAEPRDLNGEAKRLIPDLIVYNRATPTVRASSRSWVELEVRSGPGSLHANIKLDGRSTARVEKAQMSDVLTAPDETEKTFQRA